MDKRVVTNINSYELKVTMTPEEEQQIYDQLKAEGLSDAQIVRVIAKYQ